MPTSVELTAGIGAFFQVLRISIDIIIRATQRDAAYDERKEMQDKGPAAAASSMEKELLVDASAVEAGKKAIWIKFGIFLHFCSCAYFLFGCVFAAMSSNDFFDEEELAFEALPMGCAAVVYGLFLLSDLTDGVHAYERFGHFARTCYLFSNILVLFSCAFAMLDEKSSTLGDIISLVILACGTAFAALECKMIPYPKISQESQNQRRALLSKKALLMILKPYFWPKATATSATLNRIRAMLTWVFVVGSKCCSLLAPIFIGKAAGKLASTDYTEAIQHIITYVMLILGTNVLKECQSLIYLRVAQAAFVQLSEDSFKHLHSLSLDWHLRKKLGETIRKMDRGIQACDSLMKYLFLWLLPALSECLLVTIIFAAYFNYFPLALNLFCFIYLYLFLTIVLTLWRKKFRKSVARSDNDWHDKCTDSLVNFETVKYFTAEEHEIKRFATAVEKYQKGSVNVQASLSLLNTTQQLLMQTCIGLSLCLAVIGIKDRTNCCIDNGCEDEFDFECCEAIGQATCPGLNIGDFVTVLSYTTQIFIPLNFLGSIYTMIINSLIDLADLSGLLSENPDVIDSLKPVPLPKNNPVDPANTVQFDNVIFRYPTQSEGAGLKGVSFTMKKGTTTAIVGPTGSGKTTISRLLFRFYDVLEGCVKVNGVDIRSVKQRDLRSIIGVVPQAAVLFNDTLAYNIKYGNQNATDEDLQRVARDAQIESFIENLPDKWEATVGDRGLKLSGGEKQRTAIARCLLKDPPIVILDEATSALDSLTENSVQAALDRLGEDRTVLVIAHRLGTIRNADNIIVLKDGVVAEEGNHEKLLEKEGIYAEMWNTQLHNTSDSRGILLE